MNERSQGEREISSDKKSFPDKSNLHRFGTSESLLNRSNIPETLCSKCSDKPEAFKQRSVSLNNVNSCCENCGTHLLQVPKSRKSLRFDSEVSTFNVPVRRKRSKKLKRRAKSLLCVFPLRRKSSAPSNYKTHRKSTSDSLTGVNFHSLLGQRLTPRRASSHPVAPLIVKSSNEDPEINESVAASVDEENTNEATDEIENLVEEHDSSFQDALNDVGDEIRRQKPPSTLNLASNNNNLLDSSHTASSNNNSPFVKEIGSPSFPSSPVKEDKNTINEKSKSTDDSANKRSMSRKKKRNHASWYNVLSPSYRQKNEHFHKFFKEVPDGERLLADVSCALVNDILVQGRLYISENYICFHSNFLRWQKVVVTKFADCISITKEKLARIFPNSICIHSESKGKQLFTSFTSRDRTFAQISRIWELSKNEQPMPPQQLWDTVRYQYGSDLGCSSESDYVKPDSADESSKKKKKNSKKKSKESSLKSSNTFPTVSSSMIHTPSESTSAINATNFIEYSQPSADDDLHSEENHLSSNKSFIGAYQTDTFTYSDPVESHHILDDLNHLYMNEQYPIPAFRLFNILFGEDCSFYKDYLIEKGTNNIQFDEWSLPSSTDGNRTRTLDYVLPLNHPLGPKSSRIVEKQILYQASDLGRSYGIDSITQNYNIPYADYFQSIVRYSIKSINPSSSELKVSVGLKFLKDPWGMVKNFIEKNAYAGIQENFQRLNVELRKYVTSQVAITQKVSRSPKTESNVLRHRKPRVDDVIDKSTEKPKTAEEMTSSAPKPAVSNTRHDDVITTSIISRHSIYLLIFIIVLILLLLYLLFINYSMHQRLKLLEEHKMILSDPHRSLDDVLREHLETISFKLDLLKQRSEEDRIWMQDNLNNQNLMITNLYDKIAQLMTNSTIHS